MRYMNRHVPEKQCILIENYDNNERTARDPACSTLLYFGADRQGAFFLDMLYGLWYNKKRPYKRRDR